jgi:sarcosine oxidase subunit beta
MSEAEKITADVVVVGAGIIGASCAFRLSQQGLKVVVLEAQPVPAQGSTGQSAAGVRVQFTEEVNIRISWESIQEYRNFAELYGEDAGYRPVGYLFLVPPAEEVAHLAGCELQRRLGAPVEVISIEEGRKIVDFDPAGISTVTFGPADGVVDPHRITHTYLRMAKANGVKVLCDTPLLEAQQVGSGWLVKTPSGLVEANYLVNTAGAWAGEVGQRAGLEVSVFPVRRMIYMTAPTPWQHIYPLTIDIASGFYLRSEGQRVLFGRSNPDEPPGFTAGIDWDWFEETLAVGLERCPWLEETGLDRQASWYGYYEVTPDHNPILGRMPGIQNWINAAGFSGHGVQQAPMIGRLIAEELLDGRATSINIDPLRIERFASAGKNQLHEHHII